MEPTLLILAAGMASRYGSMKQMEGFGPEGETIMDYSIYDAIRAGFTKVVFIIRKDFADNFKAKWLSITFTRNYQPIQKDSLSLPIAANHGEPLTLFFVPRES